MFAYVAIAMFIITSQSHACSYNCICIDGLSIIMCKNISKPPVIKDQYMHEGRHIIIEDSNLTALSSIQEYFPVAEYIILKNTTINCTLIYTSNIYIEADLCIKHASAVRTQPKIPRDFYPINPQLVQHLGINVIVIIVCVLNIGSICIYAITKNR